MPELPEAETVRRQLERDVVGSTVRGVTARDGGRDLCFGDVRTFGYVRRCGTPIRNITFAGRGTHYCPRCQA